MELEGLNERQRELADLMWERQSPQELQDLLDSLESDQDKRDCTLILRLILLNAIEEETEMMQEFPYVRSYLRGF
jgi:hypothetical protein